MFISAGRRVEAALVNCEGFRTPRQPGSSPTSSLGPVSYLRTTTALRPRPDFLRSGSAGFDLQSGTFHFARFVNEQEATQLGRSLRGNGAVARATPARAEATFREMTGFRHRGKWNVVLILDGAVAVHVVVPVRVSHLHFLANDEAPEQREAERTMLIPVGLLQRRGIWATGTVGDDKPLESMTDALAAFPATNVLLALPPEEDSYWLERDLLAKARALTEFPVTQTTVAVRRPPISARRKLAS